MRVGSREEPGVQRDQELELLNSQVELAGTLVQVVLEVEEAVGRLVRMVTVARAAQYQAEMMAEEAEAGQTEEQLELMLPPIPGELEEITG